MEYMVGKRYSWVPLHWKWDKPQDVTVKRLYPRGRALMSNGVICDENGMAMIYGAGKEVGKVVEIMDLDAEFICY